MSEPALRLATSHEPDPELKGLGRPLPIRLSRIKPLENQPRRFFDPRTIEALADDIKAKGQNTPVQVCRHQNEPGIFTLIGGERRWRAFHVIKEKYPEEDGGDPIVLAFVDVVKDYKELRRKARTDNLHREDLVPLDEAAEYYRMRYEEKMTIDEIVAESGGKSVSHIENYLWLHKLPEAVKRFMDPMLPKNERLSITAAIDIAKSPAKNDMKISLAKEAMERDLGVHEVKTLIEMRTGQSSLGVGGNLRKPSDEYKLLRSFLGRTLKTAQRMKKFDMGVLYYHREQETADRKRDAREIGSIMGVLQTLLDRIEKKP